MKAIVLDFDEVIVKGSDAVKQAAWPEVFKNYGDAFKPFIHEAQALQGHGAGGDRFTMMRYVFEKLGEPEEKIPTLVAEGARIFDEVIQKGIVNIGVEKEVMETIDQLSQKYDLFINTATPLEPFQKTIDALGLRKYFPEERVYGRPHTKVENLAAIAEGLGIQPLDILFIGDSPNDYKAAKAFGCHFTAMATESDPWTEGERPENVIHSLAEFKEQSHDKPGERMV